MDEQSIFLAALEQKTIEERNAFLNGACKSDSELRRRIDSLLQQHDPDDSFLEKPALDRTMDVNRDALEAGPSQGFSVDEAVVLGDPGHSVLQALGQTMDLPRVMLRDLEQEGADPIQRPGSPEIPTETRTPGTGWMARSRGVEWVRSSRVVIRI